MNRRHKIGTVRCQGRDLVQRVMEQLGSFEEAALGVVPGSKLPTDEQLDELHWQLQWVANG